MFVKTKHMVKCYAWRLFVHVPSHKVSENILFLMCCSKQFKKPFYRKKSLIFFLFEDFIHYIKYNNPNLLELNNLLSKNHFLPPNSPRNIADIIIFF